MFADNSQGTLQIIDNFTEIEKIFNASVCYFFVYSCIVIAKEDKFIA